MIKRIGIAGAAGSGKTTAASYLVEEHGFTVVGFATPLYDLGKIHNSNPEEWHPRIYGWAVDHLEPLGFSNNDIWSFTERAWDVMQKTPVVEGKNRTLLQELGTGVGRNFYEHLWTDIFEKKVEELGDVPIVNDQCRFKNELATLDRLGFKIIFLELEESLREKRYLEMYGITMTEEQKNHSSEKDLPYIKDVADFIIDNSQDIDHLYSSVGLIANHETQKTT
jgi:hypothetical protein